MKVPNESKTSEETVIMADDDTIRRLKLLSKAQTALLKAYLFGKLTEGEKLVTRTIDYIAAKNSSTDVRLQELKEALQALKLHEIDVDVRSTQVLLHDELAALRNFVEHGAPIPAASVLPPPPPPEASGSSNNTAGPSINEAELKQLKERIQALEREKRSLKEGGDKDVEKLRQQLKDAQVELSALKEMNSAASESASSHASAQIQVLTQKLADREMIVTAKDESLAEHKKEIDELQATIKKDAAKLKDLKTELNASQDQLEKVKSDSAAAIKSWEQRIKTQEAEMQEKTRVKLHELETRLEAEKEEMMEAMAQEIEEIENAKEKEHETMTKQIEELTQQCSALKKANQGLSSKLRRVGASCADLSKTYKSHTQQTQRDINEMSQFMKNMVGSVLVNKLKDVNEEIKVATMKYRREMLERKRLHNVVQELKGNIRVFMRCRPPTKKEIDQFGNDAQCVSFPDDGQIRVYNEKNREKTWDFDEVFDTHSKQSQIYEDVSALVTSVMDGFKVCIFAYGQTGSGKTHTMSGPPDDRGVNTRALEELFSRARERSGEWTDEICVSLLEVYNEDIRDLLVDPKNAPDEKLEVKMGEFGNFVPGLTSRRVQNMDSVFQLMALADKHRSSATTNMNEHSSRSHMIMTVTVISEFKPTGMTTRGKLNLVDLAGSERINKSGATGQALKEAQNINKSLSALGDVIQARAQKQGHVPFRNSTLTYLLQDSLSQDSKTLMLVCISPVLYNSEETFCSLNFAARVKTVELGKASKTNVSATPSPSASRDSTPRPGLPSGRRSNMPSGRF